ncbi:MAG: prephenate dehydratase [Elusimicrobiota bacterium]
MTKEISKIRKEIDFLDEKILNMLNQRANQVLRIGKLKKQTNADFYVPERERTILRKIIQINKGPLPPEAVKEIFLEILNICRSLQAHLKIAYFGPEATFTHLAAIRNFGQTAHYLSAQSISDVFDEVEKGNADYGVVPIENSTEGVVNHTLDMFVDSDLKICAEILLEISHCLLSKENNLKNIKIIYSHFQPFAQCRHWLENNFSQAKKIEAASTAEAAKLAATTTKSAAIASSLAAQIYGLNILARKLEDKTNNYTRFLVIGKKQPGYTGQDKTSILFLVKDRVGTLHDMLVPFRKHKINLTKIESRPTKQKAWEYLFFVDFLGHISEKKVKLALNELTKSCLYTKILGSYPRSE